MPSISAEYATSLNLGKNTEKAAGLFKAMQVIFNFSVVVKTLATYYYSKEKRERTNS